MENKSILSMMCLCVIVCSGCALELRKIPSSNQAEAKPITTKQIGMSGYGKVFYDANVCDLSFSVVTLAGDDLAQSFQEHRKKTSDISKFMIQYGGPDTVCAAKATILKRNEIHQPNGSTTIKYEYETDYSSRFKIREDVGLLQNELVARGVNQITSMELRSSKYNDLLKKARDLALKDAREKVEYIAGLTGWEIVDLVDVGLVNENDRSWLYGGRPLAGSRARAIEDSGSSFETYIDAQINATFLLKKKDK
jgi:uncharacterized protein YggE